MAATTVVASVTTKFPTVYAKPSTNLNKNSQNSVTYYCFSPLKITSNSFRVRAFNSNSNSNREDDNPAIDKEDMSYILKLGVGTFAGAAVIKYGSILFPEITQPNISQALVMIFAPVLVAIAILVNKSRVQQ